MTKFSDFIRNPGTAGPPTREGIRALGFALQSDFPVELEDYLWLGGSQTFTGGKKTQGQTNLGVLIGTDVQAQSAALSSLAGLTTVADRMVYTTAPDTYATTVLTAFIRTLLDDTTAGAARTTLGLGNVDNTSDASKPVSTATQNALDLKAPLASPALTGNPTAPTQLTTDNSTRIATTAFVKAVLGGAYFSANKGGTDQTGVVSVTNTKVTFPAEAFDVGGYYDAATSRWTPPAGPVYLSATLSFTGSLNGSGGSSYVVIYKNGVAFRFGAPQNGANTGTQSGHVAALDVANGTDFYEVYGLATTTTGTATVTGTATLTRFEGHTL